MVRRKKKRVQPWRAAAREKLRKAALGVVPPTAEELLEPASDDEFEAVADALIELARPYLDAFGDALTEADANRLISEASLAYNKSISGAVSTLGEAESLVERIHGLRERFARMTEIRRTRFAHLRRPILGCKVIFVDRDNISIDLELVSLRRPTDMFQQEPASE